MTLIVTVDGPGGTGKSSVSRAVAAATGLPHLDTGAFYRAATVAVLEGGDDPNDEEVVYRVTIGLDLDQTDGVTTLNGRDVSEAIRGVSVTESVAVVSAHAPVRAHLVTLQREWVQRHGGRAVVEGRDIGSAVFPNADVKVYLDAPPEVRAIRRALQTGEDAEQAAERLASRDHHDSTREVSPLVVPDGAVVVDTSDMTFQQVVDTIVTMVESAESGKS